jgi:hypothetical protein
LGGERTTPSGALRRSRQRVHVHAHEPQGSPGGAARA